VSKRYNELYCHAEHLGAEHAHRVSNQPDSYDSTRSISSVLVCGERVCTLDARAYVERSSGETAHVRPARGHDCELCDGVDA
jgi:hypothetical protein